MLNSNRSFCYVVSLSRSVVFAVVVWSGTVCGYRSPFVMSLASNGGDGPLLLFRHVPGGTYVLRGGELSGQP